MAKAFEVKRAAASKLLRNYATKNFIYVTARALKLNCVCVRVQLSLSLSHYLPALYLRIVLSAPLPLSHCVHMHVLCALSLSALSLSSACVGNLKTANIEHR